MKYYSIAEIDLTDRGWVAAYIKEVTPMVERHGGRYLARTNRFEKMEGDRTPPQMFLVLEWPSREAAMTFYASEEYRPFLQSRLAGSRGQFYLVAGEDFTGAASMQAGA